MSFTYILKKTYMLQDQLFWEKYRPQKLEDAVILPRIQKEIQKGIVTNMIFEVSPGCGKTTLARILAKKYNYKEIDASKENGVDTLRTKVESFVTEAQLFTENKEGMKVVYLEEFDRATRGLQDGLRSYIESNSDKVRFLTTINHIHKIEDALLSRFNVIHFNPQNKEERSFLLKGFANRTLDVAKMENIDVTVEDVKKIVKKCGHDFRKILNILQRIQITGSTDIINDVKGSDDDFYELVLSDASSIDIYNYLLLNYVDSPEIGIITLGQGFIKYLMVNNKDKIKCIPGLVDSFNTHQGIYPDALDPLMTLFSLIENYQKILK